MCFTFTNTETNSGGRNTITCYKCGREGHFSPKCTHTIIIDGKSSGSSMQDSNNTGATLVTDAMIDNWDEIEGGLEGGLEGYA